LISKHYPESRIGGYADIDGTVVFYGRINALLEAGMVIADVGCGRGAHREDPVRFRRDLRILTGKGAHVIGLDVDEAAAANPFVDEFRSLSPGQRWPLDDGSVDVMVADNVVEHLQRPEEFFAEARRVVRHGGYVAVRTPNKLGYVALVSQMVPNRHHGRVLGRVQEGRKEEDVFPTFYRCNTVWALRRALRENGFDGLAYGYEGQPTYLTFSSLAYRLGVWHQRWAPGFLKVTLFAFGKKVGQVR
jgi:SAM-dependent methyltransferase